MKLFFNVQSTKLNNDESVMSIGIITENNLCFYGVIDNSENFNLETYKNLMPSDYYLKSFTVNYIIGNENEIKQAIIDWLNIISDNTPIELITDTATTIFNESLFKFILKDNENILPKYYHNVCQDLEYLGYSPKKAFELDRISLLWTLQEDAEDDMYLEVQKLVGSPESLAYDTNNTALMKAIITKCLYILIDPMSFCQA